ncbi:MAG: RNA polymerase sigma factor [Bryobacteraceae bacterium]
MISPRTKEIGALGDWAGVIRRIQSGDGEGLASLCSALSEAVRPGLRRMVEPQAVEDRVQEILVIVLEAIKSGELRDPRRLMGFVGTVAHRRAIAHVREAVSRRRRFVEEADCPAPVDQSPEARFARREQAERTAAVLRKLCARDREILERFYFQEETPDQICREMHLTGTQFRLYKSRAIAKCLHLTRRSRRPVQ